LKALREQVKHLGNEIVLLLETTVSEEAGEGMLSNGTLSILAMQNEDVFGHEEFREEEQ
jgi:hypothetical protein